MKKLIILMMLAFLAFAGCDSTEPEPPPQDIENFERTDFSVGNAPFVVVGEDFDGDGDVDIAVSNTGDASVSILANNAGSFSMVAAPSVGTHPAAIVAADFNGDEKIDLIVANEGENAVDYTNDGSITILQNTSTGGTISFTTAKTITAVGSDPYGLIGVDFDEDGDVDLALSDREPSGRVRILRNDGSFNFTALAPINIGGNPRLMAASDFDGDGRVDLAVALNTDGSVAVLRNTSTQTTGPISFASPVVVALDNGPSSIVAAELTGDNRPDLAVTDEANRTWILKNTSSSGSISFTVSSISVGSGPFGITAAELEGDADLDLIVTNENSGYLTFLLNDGAGNFTPSATRMGVGQRPFGISSASFGGDSKTDFAVSKKDDNGIAILIGKAFFQN